MKSRGKRASFSLNLGRGGRSWMIKKKENKPGPQISVVVVRDLFLLICHAINATLLFCSVADILLLLQYFPSLWKSVSD